MGFRNGAFAKVWSVENKGNYSSANISISKKNKETGDYDTEFQDGFVRFVGNAHELLNSLNITENGVNIKINSCDVTHYYDHNKKKLYINYVVFECELPDNSKNSGTKNTNKGKESTNNKSKAITDSAVDDDEDELPF